MRILCPGCSTAFEVPDAALAGRSRKLRCGLCGQEWRHAAPPEGHFVGRWAELAPDAPVWPVDHSEAFAPEDLPGALEDLPHPEPRLFGQPVDDAARTEIFQAVAHESAHELPPLHDPEREDQRGRTQAEAERLADLIYAARNNGVEYEADAARQRSQRANSARVRPFLVILLVVAVAALVLIEHRLVICSCRALQRCSKISV